MIKASKNFEMNISFEELIAHNETCRIDVNSTHHFETYEGILIYVSHPTGREELSIELGVDEDGIMYEGDYGCQESFPEIPIQEGLEILESYRQLQLARADLEARLVRNRLDKDIVKVVLK